MISLFDYLEKPAGKELGKRVYKYAKIRKEHVGLRRIYTLGYCGEVMTYSPEFLDEYFKVQDIFNN